MAKRHSGSSQVTIYHNPRCTKSRQTLALLEERGIEPHVVEYLKTPLDAAAIRRLLTKLRLTPGDIVRRKEARALGLAEPDDPRDWIDHLVAHPPLLERPIVVVGDRARIGRPPEAVLELFD